MLVVKAVIYLKFNLAGHPTFLLAPHLEAGATILIFRCGSRFRET